MASARACSAAPSESATSLLNKKASEGDAGHMAGSAYCHSEVYDETEGGTDNIIAALKHNDRIHEINLGHVPNELLEEFAALAPEPFPVLTSLRLTSHRESPPVLPESFLGASVPSLRSLRPQASGFVAFHFRQYRHYFCLPMILIILNFGIFRIQDTFLLER
jgi:hypothetical protein